MSRYVESLTKSMDDQSLRLYLKRFEKQLEEAVRHISLTQEIVDDLHRAARERRLPGYYPDRPKFAWSDCAQEYRCRDCGTLTDDVVDHTCRVD